MKPEQKKGKLAEGWRQREQGGGDGVQSLSSKSNCPLSKPLPISDPLPCELLIGSPPQHPPQARLTLRIYCLTSSLMSSSAVGRNVLSRRQCALREGGQDTTPSLSPCQTVGLLPAKALGVTRGGSGQ